MGFKTPDKGKPIEKLGRKATGLRHRDKKIDAKMAEPPEVLQFSIFGREKQWVKKWNLIWNGSH